MGSELLREMKHGDGGRALDKLVEGFTSMEEAAGQLRLAIANSLVASRKEIGKAAFAVEDNLQKSQEIIESLEGKTPEQKRKIAELSGSANETAKRVAELGATNIQGTDKAAEIGKAIADEMTKAQNINKQAIAMQEAQKKQEIFAERKERGKEFLRPDSFDTRETIRDLNAATKGFGDGKRRRLLQRGANKLAEGVAPMRDQFAAERETALLAGPSRQQLNASDIMTTGGRGELERMLRGQDSNRDVNLAELKEQTIKLGEIVQAIKDTTGVVVEL